MKEFRVDVIRKTENPQQAIYLALHQCYSENYVFEKIDKIPNEKNCGEIAIKRLLEGDRNHWGCFEHPSIMFGCGYFPHSVMQQARTHRIGVSFDVTSMRYTGDRIISAADRKIDIEDVFYSRPVGFYTDRQGKKYFYSEEQRQEHLDYCLEAAKLYKQNVEFGMSEEHARSFLPFDFRQNFIVSFSLRALFHFLDMRYKKDAQLEIQQLAELMWKHTQEWVPEIATWYEKKRLGKGRLAP